MSVTEIDPPGTGPETHHLSLDSEAGSATAPASSSYVPRSSDRASYGLRHATTETEHVLQSIEAQHPGAHPSPKDYLTRPLVPP